MKLITNQELQTIQGGGISAWLVAGIFAAVTFIAGIFDGFTRPSRCFKRK